MPSEKTRGAPTTWLLELIKLVPGVLWAMLAVFAFLSLKDPVLKALERGEVSKISFLSLQLEFARQEISAIDPARKGVLSSPTLFKPFEERINRLAPKIVGASILWIDDKHPTQNLRERRAFSALGMNIDIVRNLEEAKRLLTTPGVSYDLILSDMRHGQDDTRYHGGCKLPLDQKPEQPLAGCRLLSFLQYYEVQNRPKVIFYLFDFSSELGLPPFVFGMTNRVDELINLVLDALDRFPEDALVRRLRENT